MKTFALILTALIAFAANSVLNRAALIGEGTDPAAFMGLRMLSGTVMLVVIVSLRGKTRQLVAAGSWVSAGALLLYAVAFSFAYLKLDSGLGALILFGGVQITMFAGSVLAGQSPGLWRWVGSILGLAGLAIMFQPGGAAPDPFSVLMMLMAAFGWGVYSLRGQGAGDPLNATASNFLRAAPLAAAIWLLYGTGISWAGAALAVASGALASGLGYTVWYAVLPRIDASLAAIAQLTVPLIALGGGILFLGEALTLTFVLASTLILGGVVLAVLIPAQSR